MIRPCMVVEHARRADGGVGSPRCVRGTAIGLLAITALPVAAADTRSAAVNAPGPLEEIVVVANKAPRPLHSIPAQVTVIDAARIEFEQVQTLDDVVRYEPALEADFNGGRFGASGISIRGIGGNRVALEVDGVPLPQQYAVGNFADSSRLALDPTVVGRIEILRGPASTLYGSDAIGGVIAITTVDGADLVRPGEHSYAGARGGWFGENDAALGSGAYAWAGARDSAVAAFSYRTGHESDNKARGVLHDNIDFDQWQGFGKWTHEFDSGAAARLSLDYYERNTDSDIRSVLGYERFANTTSLRGDDEQRRDRETLQIEFPAFGWLTDSSLMLYRQSNTTTQLTDELRTSRGTPVFLQRDFELRELGYGGELRTRADAVTGPLAHVVVAGIEWDHQRLSEKRDGAQLNLSTGEFVRAILGEQFPVRDLPTSITDEIGIYAQDEITYGPVTLVAGVRWDDYSLDADTDSLVTDPSRVTDLDADKVTVRIGAIMSVGAGVQLYAHYAEGFRAPPPGEVNLLLDIPLFNIRALPNPDLRPERSDTVETGLRWRYERTRFESAVYYTDYEDFIESRVNLGPDPVTGTLLFQSRNLAEAHIYGIEAGLTQGLGAFHAALERFELEAGFHGARGENDVSGRPLNEINPLKAVFALHWEPTGVPLHTALRVTHLAEQTRVDSSNGPLFVPPSATIVDLNARWSPLPAVTMELGLYNLGDERYWRYADVRRLDPGDPRIEIASQPGRYAQVTMSLRY